MAQEDTDTIEFMGVPGSPYSRKMLALLRYRNIPHTVRWGNPMMPVDGYPKPKVSLLPTFYFRDKNGDLEAAVDSTPIIRRLENMSASRSVIPTDPALAFINYLLEDYGDEWLTKCMFHYRWHFQDDIENAGPLLAYWHDPRLEKQKADGFIQHFTDRQVNRLYVVGSNDITAETIESSYRRCISILDNIIQKQGYILGARPSSADFAFYGQLTQLAIVEPTSAAEARNISPRVRAWVDRMDDLSGSISKNDDWIDLTADNLALKAMLTEVGRVYVPFLFANAAAVQAGEDNFTCQIDGREWSQPTFAYQAKCLNWIMQEYAALSDKDRSTVNTIFAGTGCEALTGR